MASGGPGFAGGAAGSAGPGFAGSSTGSAGPGFAGSAAGSGGSGFAGGAAGSAGPGFAGGAAGSRSEGREGWGRLGSQPSRGVHGGAAAGESAAQVIRQRENGVPEERSVKAEPTASIAPDGLESFARDLRALRAKAELDYPEMAEASHYTMKTLVSAAGGLRLPTLPVAVAYVRACGGNAAEWEDRWQRLADRITADAAKKRRGEGEERLALPEPSDPQVLPEPPAPAAAADPGPEAGEVYVITSAKPRQPGW